MLTTQLRYGHVTDQMKRESSARMESYIKDVLNLQRVKQRVFPLKKVKEKPGTIAVLGFLVGRDG